MLKAIFQSTMILGVFISFSPSQAAVLDDGIRIGTPSAGGTGCPEGTASLAVSPDGREIRILLDNFTAEVGGETGRKLDRKACNLAIPVHVPKGLSVALNSLVYRGFALVSRGGSASLNVEAFFAGLQGEQRVRKFSRGEGDFTFTAETGDRLNWSPCGADVILRVNAGLSAKTRSAKRHTLVKVDSVGSESGAGLRLNWRACE